MFFKKKEENTLFKEKTKAEPVNLPELKEGTSLRTQVQEQQVLIEELFRLVLLLADHKNYAFVQKQRDHIQNLLDNIKKP